MTTDGEAAPGNAPADRAGRLPFDITKANQARAYDYMLGGKVQVVQTL